VATQQIRANKRKEKQSKQHATTLGSFGGGIAKLFGAFSAVHADDDGEEDGAHDAGEQGQWANGVEESGEDDEEERTEDTVGGAAGPARVDVDPSEIAVSEMADDDAVAAEFDDADTAGGAMSTYLERVHERLQDEARVKQQGGKLIIPGDDKWLLQQLKEDGWWLLASKAAAVARQFDRPLELREMSYYRDIYVWLPDLQDGGQMPPCPNCRTASAVKSAITKRMYFDSKYFKDRVRRRVLPADHLYARVRAVYAYYGRQEDPETNKPLFNEVGEPYLLLCSSIAPGLVLFICRAVRVRVAALFVCFCPVLMHYSGDVVRLWVSVSIYLHPSRQRGRKQRTC
jgi:hypothetical protein